MRLMAMLVITAGPCIILSAMPGLNASDSAFMRAPRMNMFDMKSITIITTAATMPPTTTFCVFMAMLSSC